MWIGAPSPSPRSTLPGSLASEQALLVHTQYSTQMRRFEFTAQGTTLQDVYTTYQQLSLPPRPYPYKEAGWLGIWPR